MTVLAFLQEWAALQCNDDWEHGHGIIIETLDNPGWSLQVHLAGTDLENAPYLRFEKNLGDHNWIHCWVEGNVFNGVGGIGNLEDILDRFQAFVKANRQ